jgi:hypothetical protein
VPRLTLDEDWYRHYDETSLYTRQDVVRALSAFLQYAGYTIVPPEVIGFMKPDVAAERAGGGQRYRMIFVVREGINEAVEGFRQLASAKCFRKDSLDYVLALPPVSEHFLIEFLIEREEWFFPIKDGLFQLWLVNPSREKVDCILGWPRDDDFRHYFANPQLAAFASYIAEKATAKIMAQEFG